VYSVEVNGNTVYAGGSFTDIDGESRNYLAAIDISTGEALSWAPEVDDTVFAVTVSGGTVYAGGVFTSVNGENRNCIAAIDAGNGSVGSWNPNLIDHPFYKRSILALAVDENTVFAGGAFSGFGDQERSCLAALDATTGTAAPWKPDANSRVRSIAVNNSTVYAGGTFAEVSGILRFGFVQFDDFDPLPVAGSFVPSENFTTSLQSNSVMLSLPQKKRVTIILYDIKGRIHKVVADGLFTAGNHSIRLTGTRTATGMYLLVVRAGDYYRTRTLVVP